MRGRALPFFKLGGRVLYRREEVEAFEESQLQRAKAVSAAVARVGLREANTLTAASLISATSSQPTASVPPGTMRQRPE